MSNPENSVEYYGMPESALTNACQGLRLSGAGLRGVSQYDYVRRVGPKGPLRAFPGALNNQKLGRRLRYCDNIDAA